MNAPESKLILIVEDFEDDAKLLEMLLTNEGIFNPTRVALSAEEAITYLEGVPPYSNRAKYPLPTVIFVDLKLPGMNGFELLRWLKTRLDPKQTFTVVFSATGDLLSVQTAYALGANSFLVKPCRVADLKNLAACYPDFWVRTPPPALSSQPQEPLPG
ncbi:MAG TPA: response regulator [Candidatus Angelobacter sp.]|nr:response regulator [Candidatus Angelobacter sp.]